MDNCRKKGHNHKVYVRKHAGFLCLPLPRLYSPCSMLRTNDGASQLVGEHLLTVSWPGSHLNLLILPEAESLLVWLFRFSFSCPCSADKVFEQSTCPCHQGQEMKSMWAPSLGDSLLLDKKRLQEGLGAKSPVPPSHCRLTTFSLAYHNPSPNQVSGGEIIAQTEFFEGGNTSFLNCSLHCCLYLI